MAKHSAELRELDDGELLDDAWPRPSRSCSTCASSTSPGSSTTPRARRSCAQDIARINTDLRAARDRRRRGAGDQANG